MTTPLVFDDSVSIIVPTFRREEGLFRALESLKGQSGAHPNIELIVSDNDPKGSAKNIVADFAKSAPFPTLYVHAPEPGVANARNAALEAAKGRYIAFLDDDQTASENWLAEMLQTLRDGCFCAVFTRIIAKFDTPTIYSAFFSKFFAREFSELESGEIDHYYGCGSSLIDRSVILLPTPAFSPAMNETGGEDDVLFEYLSKKGGRMGWTRKCFANEHVPASRLTTEYVRRRSFAFGQGPTRMHVDLGPFSITGIAKWMLIGTAQFVIYVPLAIGSRLIKSSAYMHFLSKASMGAGKVLWQKRFRPKLYGAATL